MKNKFGDYLMKTQWTLLPLKNENGRAGWILLWLLGVPVPVLLVLFGLRGCT